MSSLSPRMDLARCMLIKRHATLYWIFISMFEVFGRLSPNAPDKKDQTQNLQLELGNLEEYIHAPVIPMANANRADSCSIMKDIV